jgi:hypothetical protein
MERLPSMDEHPTSTIAWNETKIGQSAECVQPLPVDAALDTEAAVADQPEYISVIRATRTWIQYGVFGFAILCIVIGAVEALFGR